MMDVIDSGHRFSPIPVWHFKITKLDKVPLYCIVSIHTRFEELFTMTLKPFMTVHI